MVDFFNPIDASGSDTYPKIQQVTSNNKFKKLKNQRYILNNIFTSTEYTTSVAAIDNRFSEEFVFAEVLGTPPEVTVELAFYPTSSTTTFNKIEETYLSSLKVIKPNLFIDITIQKDLIVCSGFKPIASSYTYFQDSFINGDGFIGYYTYATLAAISSGDLGTYTDGYKEGIRNIKTLPFIGRHNVNLRHVTLGDYTTYFTPAQAVPKIIPSGEFMSYWINIHETTKAWNQFLYNKDFSISNYLENPDIHNPNSLNISIYPYRIQRSLASNKESNLEDGWKSYKPLDYFETAKSKGRITNLVSWGEDILIIHHERALFRTRDKAVLQTTTLNVQLGSGDIFEIEPKEERPTAYGYGGTQHKFGCLLCEIGYIYPDADRGEWFLYDGENLHNISKGLRHDFKQYLKSSTDNPFNNNGISTAFDQELYRFIFSLKANQSFTTSFDIMKGEWVSYHDIYSDFLFNTRKNLYSIKNLDVHQHNTGARGTYYGVTYPFFVDIVVNHEPTKEKILSAVYWISRYYNSQGLDIDKTIDYITVRSNKYSTGKIPIKFNSTNSILEDRNNNCKRENEVFSFNDVYNRLKPTIYPSFGNLFNDYTPNNTDFETPYWADSEQIRDKSFVVRLEFSNLQNDEIQLLSLSGLNRQSK